MAQLKVSLGAAALLACLLRPPAALAVDVEVTGAVIEPGMKHLPGHARLSDAALASPLRDDAYPLGASWQRASLRVPQTRLKAGLMFELDRERRKAFHEDRTVLRDTIASLVHWLRPMPVTGRQVALLDPRAVEINAAENWPVAEGDALHFPRRPSTIRVVGAVAAACELPLVPLQNARDYLRDCKPSSVADADWIFVIQPDGRVAKQGVALWNRGQPMPLAPGAMVYVPLRESGFNAVSRDLNQELAAYLATQPLDATEGH